MCNHKALMIHYNLLHLNIKIKFTSHLLMSHEWSHNENKNIGKSKSNLYYISKGKISKSAFIYISIWGCKYNKDYKDNIQPLGWP